MASSEGGVCKSMQAWAQSVNDAGGINGHKINLIVKDDGSNVSTAVTAAHELIEQDHVIAIVGDQSNPDSAWAAYVAGKGVPVVGGLPVQAPFISNADFFNAGTNIIAGSIGLLQEAKNAGKGPVGFLYCAETPLCAQAAPLYQAGGSIVGVSVPVIEKVSGTAPDYTAICLKMKSAGIKSFLVGSNAVAAQRVTDACKAQGVDAVALAIDGTITKSWLKNKNFEGMIGVELVAPFFDTSNPGVKAFQDALTKYAPDVLNGEEYGPNAMYAWVAGKLFEAAAKAGNLGDNPTSADVKKGLYALKGETLGGLTAPLTFQEGKPSFDSCYFPVTIQNGQFKAPNGTKPSCVSMAKLAPLLKGLGG